MKKFKNKDAFRLLRYYCPSCNKIEYIWNSQDITIPNTIECSECQIPNYRVKTNKGMCPELQIPELTPLGIRWFIIETKELYTSRIEKQIKVMADILFIDTTRDIVKNSLLSAFIPNQIQLVDPLTLNFEEQVQVLLSDN